MLKKLIHKLLITRHPWRHYLEFNELSELYVTMMVRGIAMSMAGIFIPIYLYRYGFSITEIFMVFAVYFSTRVVTDFIAAKIIARIGTKHGLVLGQSLQIMTSVMLLGLSTFHWPLWLIGSMWGLSTSMFYIPFHVHFSIIMHRHHGGKELGYEQIMEKVGTILGPVVGGVVATFVGAQFIFLISAILLLLGLIPLFRTPESLGTQQRVSYTKTLRKPILATMPSYVGMVMEHNVTTFMWPLFLAAVIIPGSGVFAKVGIMTSMSVLVSIISTQVIGHLADEGYGRKLLRFSSVVNSVFFVLKATVQTYFVALSINIASEAIAIGARLPYNKGFYEQAGLLGEQRITYITVMEILGCICKAIMWWIMAVISVKLAVRDVMTIGFGVAAIFSLLAVREVFPSLKPQEGRG